MKHTCGDETACWNAIRFCAWQHGVDAQGVIQEAKRRNVPARELHERFERSARHILMTFRARVADDAFTPGIFHLEVLDQTTFWIDGLGRIWRITSPDFSTDHLINATLFLRQLAPQLMEILLPLEDLTHDEATEQMQSMPLMGALFDETWRRVEGASDGSR